MINPLSLDGAGSTGTPGGGAVVSSPWAGGSVVPDELASGGVVVYGGGVVVVVEAVCRFWPIFASARAALVTPKVPSLFW